MNTFCLPLRAPVWALLLCVSLFALPPLSAQKSSTPPKAGKYYEDSLKHGYKFKAPAKFEVTPAGPEEANVLVKFSAGKDSKGGGAVHVLLFNSEDSLEKAVERRQRNFYVDTNDYLAKVVRNTKFKLLDPESEGQPLKLKGNTQKGTAFEYRAGGSATGQLAYVAEYPLDDTRTLAIVFLSTKGTMKKKDSKKWLSSFEKMARSFERVKLQEVKAGKGAKNLKGFRAERYQELAKSLPAGGGWRIETSDNYFVVTDVDDPGFIRKIIRRLEAIRRYYERDFPLENAYKRTEKREPKPIELPEGFEDMPEELQKEIRERLEEAARKAAEYDPMLGVPAAERSRCCVVKVFKDRQAYFNYGAPANSAGYWWPYTEELCLYDNPKDREQSLGTLFHEAFHQYMYYYCGGEVELHGWFNEGCADFYGGYVYLNGQIRPKEGDRRLPYIKSIIKNRAYAPLDIFLTWFRNEYYGRNKLGKSQGANYAQGWSFVNFLLRGNKEKPKGWKRAWSKIVENYLQTALELGDAKQALEVVFEDVDIDKMQTCWLAFMDKQ